MKTCILFTGLPRTLELGYIFHKYYLIDEFNADVFLHTWDVVNSGHRFNGYSINTGRVNNPSNTLEKPCFELTPHQFIEQKMNCKDYIIDSYSKFQPNYDNVSDKRITSTRAMTYSWFKANELKRKYEEKNNFKYDLVIRVRTDSIPYTTIPKKELEKINDTLYFSAHINRNYYNFDHIPKGTYPDEFVFGSSSLMDIFSQAYYTFEETGLLNEQLTSYHISKNNLKADFSDIGMKIFDFYTEDEWYLLERVMK